jgi:hypothetical protein
MEDLETMHPGALMMELPDAVQRQVNGPFADHVMAAPSLRLMICPGETAGDQCPHALPRLWLVQAPQKQPMGRACRPAGPRTRS